MMQNEEIIIDDRKIGSKHRPFIIAELSANHNGSLKTAMTLLERAKDAGADAVKIQTYKPDTITLNSTKPEFLINSGLWKGKSLYSLYDEAHMPWEWHKSLFDYAKKLKLTIFSSPFDHSAVDLLEDLDVPAYKIASFEIIDLPLIEYVAKTKKPMIISTGMASKREIQDAIDVARSAGCNQIALLRCVSGYPAPAEEYNLLTIPDLANTFGTVVGLSDHTLDNTTAITSIAMGGAIIEKHFTLDRMGGGPDDSFSLEPSELEQLCHNSLTAWRSIGSVEYKLQDSESISRKHRRSLYFIKDLPAGHKISEGDIKSVRPGYGMEPKYFSFVIGRTLQKNVTYATPVKRELLK
jgi:pseudaminic acid synthase